MKFTYENDGKKTKVVAALYYFNGGPELCLAVDTGHGQKVWFYSDGGVSIQEDKWGDEKPVKEFYPGDSITITF